MAYIENDLDPEKKEEENTSSEQQITEAPGSPIEGMGATVPNQPAAQPQVQGSGFSGIKQYLNSNQKGLQNLAGKTANLISQTGQTAKDTLNTGLQNYNQQVDQNTLKLDQDLLNRAVSSPINFQQNQEDVDKLSNLRSGYYQGPKAFEETEAYQPVQKAVTQAKQYGEDIKSDIGLQNLLAEANKSNPRYSQGQRALDAALLLQNQQANQQLKDAVTGYGDLDTLLSGASQQAKDYATQAQTTSQNTAQTINDAFSRAIANLSAPVYSDPRYTNEQAARAAGYTGQFGAGGAAQWAQDPNNMARLLQEFNRITGQNLTVMPGQEGNPRLRSVEEDQANLAALTALANKQQEFVPDPYTGYGTNVDELLNQFRSKPTTLEEAQNDPRLLALPENLRNIVLKQFQGR